MPNYHATDQINAFGLGFGRRRDDLRGATGIFRGLLIGAALWTVVGVVALSMGSSGDARDVATAANAPAALAVPTAATPPKIVTIDRGGRTFAH
jgi:hypothetical protein